MIQPAADNDNRGQHGRLTSALAFMLAPEVKNKYGVSSQANKYNVSSQANLLNIMLIALNCFNSSFNKTYKLI